MGLSVFLFQNWLHLIYHFTPFEPPFPLIWVSQPVIHPEEHVLWPLSETISNGSSLHLQNRHWRFVKHGLFAKPLVSIYMLRYRLRDYGLPRLPRHRREWACGFAREGYRCHQLDPRLIIYVRTTRRFLRPSAIVVCELNSIVGCLIVSDIATFFFPRGIAEALLLGVEMMREWHD